MYVAVRRYEGMTDPQRVAEVAQEGFVPMISEMPGFVAYYFALYATTSPAVTWGGFGSKGARCSAMNPPALKVDCSSASLCSKTLVETITPSPASTQ